MFLVCCSYSFTCSNSACVNLNFSLNQCSAIEGYGAKLVKCEVSPTSRKETCQRIADENPGFKIVHPYDDVNVIAGQSTIALELHEQVAGLDAIVVPVSGGGMSSGIALATKAMNPSCKVILTAPEVNEEITFPNHHM